MEARRRRWGQSRAGRARMLAACGAGVVLAIFSAGECAAAQSTSYQIVVNGRPAASSSDARPVQLYPNQPAEVQILVRNHEASPVHIATVRYEGNVLDLPLFSYDSNVGFVVPADSSKLLVFPITMTGIKSQATGLIVSSVTLLGPDGATLYTQSLVSNVHGSLTSLYGLFGLAVLVLTLSSLALALFDLARHRLSQNRWKRGVRFLIPGFGVGLVIIFTFSAFAVFAPGPGHWLPILILASAIGFALGYLTPAPEEEQLDDYDQDVLMAQIIVVDEDPLEAPVPAGVSSSVSAPISISVASSDSRATVAPSSQAPPDARPTADPSMSAGSDDEHPGSSSSD